MASTITIMDPISGRTIYITALDNQSGYSGGIAAAIMATIAARDAIAVSERSICWVIDATGDSTVTTGGALYEWNSASSSWIKLSEAESFDVAEKLVAALANYYTRNQIDARTLSATFTNTSSNLINGILTIGHTLGDVVFSGDVVNNLGKKIVPDDITCVNGAILVNLKSYLPLSNTWRYTFKV